jgi:hypothetical protein
MEPRGNERVGFLLLENLDTENQEVGFQDVGNRTLLNTEILSTDSQTDKRNKLDKRVYLKNGALPQTPNEH